MKINLFAVFLIIPIVVCALWFILFIGFSFSSDVTNNRDYWGKYDLNEDYILDRPVFIIQDKGADYLVPESKNKRCLGLHRLAPESVERFKSDPLTESVLKINNSVFKLSVKGVLEQGTSLKITQIKRLNGWSLWTGDATVIYPIKCQPPLLQAI